MATRSTYSFESCIDKEINIKELIANNIRKSILTIKQRCELCNGNGIYNQIIHEPTCEYCYPWGYEEDTRLQASYCPHCHQTGEIITYIPLHNMASWVEAQIKKFDWEILDCCDAQERPFIKASQVLEVIQWVLFHFSEETANELWKRYCPFFEQD